VALDVAFVAAHFSAPPVLRHELMTVSRLVDLILPNCFDLRARAIHPEHDPLATASLKVIPVPQFCPPHVEFPWSHPWSSRCAAPRPFLQLLESYSLSFFHNPFGMAVALLTAGDTFTAGGQ
jgi:hypothetical protein